MVLSSEWDKKKRWFRVRKYGMKRIPPGSDAVTDQHNHRVLIFVKLSFAFFSLLSPIFCLINCFYSILNSTNGAIFLCYRHDIIIPITNHGNVLLNLFFVHVGENFCCLVLSVLTWWLLHLNENSLACVKLRLSIYMHMHLCNPWKSSIFHPCMGDIYMYGWHIHVWVTYTCMGDIWS